jgi:hypothetical protein
MHHQEAWDRGILLEADRDLVEHQIHHLSNVNSAFYCGAVGGGIHAFIEFCGLQAKFLGIARAMVRSGLDPRNVNIHSGRALPVEDHDIEYLAEKFECIFGAAFAQKPELSDLFCQKVFGRRLEKKT